MIRGSCPRQKHCSFLFLDKEKPPRDRGGFVVCADYFTVGWISNWWNGGGDDNVHSKVITCGSAFQ